MFFKKGVLKNFAKITGKHLCQSFFFNKTAGLKSATLLKKGLWKRFFPVNFAKFWRTPFLTEHLWMTSSICSASINLNNIYWKLNHTYHTQGYTYIETSQLGCIVNQLTGSCMSVILDWYVLKYGARNIRPKLQCHIRVTKHVIEGDHQLIAEQYVLFYPLKISENLAWQKQSPGVFYKKAIVKDFTKFTGKHLLLTSGLQR